MSDLMIWNSIMHGCRTLAMCLALSIAGTAAAQNNQAVTLENPGQGDAHQLAYKFTSGQFMHYEVDHKMTINTQFGQTKSKTTNESQAWKQLRVVSVDEAGNATLEPVVTRVKMQAQFEEQPPVTYDSQTDQVPPKRFEKVAESIGRANSRLLFAPNGELLKITALPGAPDHIAGAADKPESQHNFLIVLPKQPVGVGAVWKDRFQVPVTVGQGLTQQVIIQRQYTLSRINGTTATIALKTSIVTPINNVEVEGQLIQRTPSGLIEFDMARGTIVSQTTAVSQQVVGALGANTLLDASSTTHEKLVPATASAPPAALR